MAQVRKIAVITNIIVQKLRREALMGSFDVCIGASPTTKLSDRLGRKQALIAK